MTATTAWQVGRATITPVIEVETITSPRFLFKDLSKTGVLDIASRAPWLRGSFVDDDGYLLQRVQCLVIDVDGVRVAVDTCVGNDKPRANPGWNNLHLPFLADLEAAGFPPDSIDAVVCTPETADPVHATFDADMQRRGHGAVLVVSAGQDVVSLLRQQLHRTP